MNIRYFDEQQVWIDSVVQFTQNIVAKNSHEIAIALTGGKTPKPIYEALGNSAIDFSRAHIYIADERFVSYDHPDSNCTMVRTALIEKHKKIASFHYIDTTVNRDDAIKKYQAELSAVPEHVFDIFFLGIGSDGHILSLFPHTSDVDIVFPSVVHTTTEVFAIHDRITMTLPYVLYAKHLILCAIGKDKLAVIQELQKGEKTVQEMPVMAIKDHPSLTFFYLK